MSFKLIRASQTDAELIWKMQLEAFDELLEKYQDHDTNPGAEPLSRVQQRLSLESTYYYLITADNKIVGAIRIIDQMDGSTKRISPLFILPDFRRKGFAVSAIREAEHIHGSENWSLSTILQEESNCRLYEKTGYRRTGKTQAVNDRLTLVFYEK